MSSELPLVAGRMEMTHEHFQRACQVAIHDFQQEPQCQSYLVALFCEAVRCSRECCEIATIRPDATELTRLRTRLVEVEADAAVMRRALEYCYLHNHYGPLDRHHERHNCVFCETVVNALSTNAGKSLLERQKEAEWLLLHSNDLPKPDGWFDRRDAFLNPNNKDVM